MRGDHIWVLQRPRTLERKEEAAKTAPPVLAFDAARNLRAGLGRTWRGLQLAGIRAPEFRVEDKGFVWIGGQGDNGDQILKFTQAGKFVMQIGQPGRSQGNKDTSNLNQPADVWVHPKTNELFVADGYGNRRVIVFDADTGAFKRMWGAFGNEPVDGPSDPAATNATEGASQPQFVSPVHAARRLE